MSWGITPVGLLRLVPSQCSIVKPFRRNDRFETVPNATRIRFEVNDLGVTAPLIMKYNKYESIDGQFKFPSTTKPLHSCDGSYRTIFGPSFAHPFVVYARTNENLSLALYRQINSREPERPGYHDELIVNQLSFMKHRTRPIIDWFSCFSELFVLTESLGEYVDQPHTKRLLRLSAYQDIVSNSKLYNLPYLDVHNWKMKPMEYAKPDSVPRLIGDMTTPGSLAGAELMSYVKQYFSDHPFSYKNCTAYFISSPSIDMLSDAFRKIIYSHERVTMIYFSDDASMCIDGVFFNTDIKSCDSSHYSIFDLLPKIMPNNTLREYMRLIVSQTLTPIKVRVDDGVSLSFKPTSPYLPSGSTLTTSLNNLAQLCMFVNYVDSLPTQKLDASALPDFVTQCCESVGYSVKYEPAPNIENLFFLKHFPVLEDGHIYPVLGYGVFTRTFGACHGDLPGKGGYTIEKASTFCHELLLNFTSRPHHDLFTRLLEKFPRHSVYTNHVQKCLPYSTQFKSQKHILTDLTSISRRYSLPESAVLEFKELLSNSTHGDLLRCMASDAFLTIDYGANFSKEPPHSDDWLRQSSISLHK